MINGNEVRTRMGSIFFSLFWLLLSSGSVLMVSCAGTGIMGSDDVTGSEEGNPESKEATGKKGGAVQVSLLTRPRQENRFAGGLSSSATKPGLKRREGMNDAKPGSLLHLAVVSEQWKQSEGSPEFRFSNIAEPDVKMVESKAIDWFLSYIKKHGFYRFPSVNLTPRKIQSLSTSEKILIVRRGNQVHQVKWDDNFYRRLSRIRRRNKEEAQRLKKNKKKILQAFRSLFNVVNSEDAEVDRGNMEVKDFFRQVRYEQEVSRETKVQKQLKRARKLLKRKKYRRAQKILVNVLKNTKGTTYYHHAYAMLQDLHLKRRQEDRD